jgi:hypothetical protein
MTSASLLFWLMRVSMSRSHAWRATVSGPHRSCRMARRSSGPRPRMSVSTLSSTAMRCSASVAIADARRQGVRRSGGARGPSRGRGSHPPSRRARDSQHSIDLENALEAGKMGLSAGKPRGPSARDAIGRGVDTDGTRPTFAWTERLLYSKRPAVSSIPRPAPRGGRRRGRNKRVARRARRPSNTSPIVRSLSSGWAARFACAAQRSTSQTLISS